jgi:hypothetical protein
MVVLDLKTKPYPKKEHNCNSISKEQIRHFSTQHTSNIIPGRDPINCPNSSKSKFPMACPKPATRVNGRHEQFQFQLIEECQRG